MINRWTEQEVTKLKKYLKQNNITTEEQALAHDYERLDLTRPPGGIKQKAAKIIKEKLEEKRFENLFGDHTDVSRLRVLLLLTEENKTNEEILAIVQAKFPKVTEADIRRIITEKYKEMWEWLAEHYGVAPKPCKNYQTFKKAWLLHKNPNTFNLSKLRRMLGG